MASVSVILSREGKNVGVTLADYLEKRLYGSDATQQEWETLYGKYLAWKALDDADNEYSDKEQDCLLHQLQNLD